MNVQRRNEDIINKFKKIRSYFDKIYITFAGCIWIFSSLWDIYQLKRFWLDFAIEIYSSILIFYMIIFSFSPKSLPLKLYNSFSIITTFQGRGITLLIISSLFLKDKHSFHKFSSILLFFGGILYIICEILVPTTPEELKKIEAMYNKNEKNEVIIQNKNDSRNVKNQLNKSDEKLNKPDTLDIKLNKKTNNEKRENTMENLEVKNREKKEETNNVEKIENKNPYDIPDEDF